MNIFDNYTKSLLSELNKMTVEYLVVGGIAVNYYGYRRTTGDIDLWIKPENESNKKNLIVTLKNLGVTIPVLNQLENLDFTTPLVFIDGEEPFKIDFMTRISGVEFGVAWNEKVIAELDGIQVPFIHLNHLILSKIATGRPQDKVDIEKLQKIQELKKK
jgi:predicted nucleotidyltransferase